MVAFSVEVPMNAITITLSDDRLAQLQEMAARFRVSPEELVRVGIEEFLARPDDAFQRAVTEVLKKNAELYRRLA
jgi:antitoxin FitA